MNHTKMITIWLGIFFIFLTSYNILTINTLASSMDLAFGSNYQTEMNQIQTEIHKKINEKNLHLAKAARARDQGDRLQFRDGNLLDARLYWKNADFHEEQARILDQEIRALEERKARLLQLN